MKGSANYANNYGDTFYVKNYKLLDIISPNSKPSKSKALSNISGKQKKIYVLEAIYNPKYLTDKQQPSFLITLQEILTILLNKGLTKDTIKIFTLANNNISSYKILIYGKIGDH